MLPSSWRYKRFHSSYLLSWLSLGLLLGLVASYFAHKEIGLYWYIVAACMLFGALHSRRWTACVVAVIAGGIIGFGRGAYYQNQLALLDSFAGQTVTLEGILSQDPVQQNQDGIWQSQLGSVKVAGKSYRGEVYATIASDTSLRRGDKLLLTGKAVAGFGSFRLSLYRAELVGMVRERNVFLDMRDAFAAGVRAVMPEPEASLGLGFVVGQKSALPDDLVEQLKVVGLTHIVVASGYNLTILVRFARRLLARRSRYLALVGSVALVIVFVASSGLSPSMNRAAIVTGLSLLAWYYGRQFHPVQLILYVASVSALLYPVYLWSDLGWLLSFAAFAGVLVVAPIVSQYIAKKSNSPPAILQLVVETLSAEFMTLPIIMVSFGYVPVFALVANLLVAPVIPFAMAATFLAGLVGMIAPWLALAAAPASILIAYVVALVRFFSSISWAEFSLTVTPLFAVIWYGLLGLWLVILWRVRRIDLRGSSVVE